ncbi:MULTISPECIES: hypothetical protein [Burkholderia]|uniref:Uncharacterized protein n=1 Tax=Burkholderia lata (strain ATCC 17760 / DSM 23089 / LMG 22485 / NCIMB 9086 / R18194 / 383) TaxID=482957 RepID=A0A833V2H9_BURL3|nr:MULTISPECIES: hypothetical protein [Burkholderia]KAF1038841.1 MAG: hypothetical protein GAK33_02177 [Burkholderia lata]
MRPSRPTDPAARFTRQRAEFTTLAACVRDPAPPLATRLPLAGSQCALPRPA